MGGSPSFGGGVVSALGGIFSGPFARAWIFFSAPRNILSDFCI
jgi:hypothetical protein